MVCWLLVFQDVGRGGRGGEVSGEVRGERAESGERRGGEGGRGRGGGRGQGGRRGQGGQW